MLPNRALIICDNPSEAHELLDFLAANGARWGNPKYDDGEPNNMYYGSCNWGEQTGAVLCYSLRDNYVGYCKPEWYHAEQQRDEWENQEDPSWNFISVDEFISRCGGSVKNETEISLEGLL